MCGISGLYYPQVEDWLELETISISMAATLSHRGPDGNGIWTSQTTPISLGHRRLAVIDLSESGHQPMVSKSGRYVICFNGEIYNYRELKKNTEVFLGSINWVGTSDTEVLLECIEARGLDFALNASVGMFAFSLWDSQQKKLFLARDRYGEKPLYYGWSGEGKHRAFLFGSELKSIRAFKYFDNAVNTESVNEYIRFTNVPAPLSIYNDIFKLLPGSVLCLNTETQCYKNHNWWDIGAEVTKAKSDQIYEYPEAISLIENQLEETIVDHFTADVPIGAFLSGGIDSSLIAALMQSQSNRPINTYTIGFNEASLNEAPFAKKVANHLGTNHTEVILENNEFFDVVSHLPDIYDEPFADSSQLATHLVCKTAREYVTVAVSGDGGDEIFGGYNRHILGPKIWRYAQLLPSGLRSILGKLIYNTPATISSNTLLRDKLQKVGVALENATDSHTFYESLISPWNKTDKLIKNLCAGGSSTPNHIKHVFGLQQLTLSEKIMLADSLCYLPNDILCKVDRASMNVSLETRAPFLDHRLTNLAWRLKLDMKIDRRRGKKILRDILSKHIPRDLIERPKSGFALPLGEWLRGPLKNWSKERLFSTELKEQGYFDPIVVDNLWQQHLSGKFEHTTKLWSILVFQSWFQNNYR